MLMHADGGAIPRRPVGRVPRRRHPSGIRKSNGTSSGGKSKSENESKNRAA
jgi:hypothetical protein